VARVLVWSPEAIEDIEGIAAYIERDSHWYAKAIVSKLIAAAESIPEYPQLGRVVPELSDANIRERVVHRYRLIYRLEETRVVIAAVIHGRQDFETEWRSRGKPESNSSSSGREEA
jgi:plasmid stabilization system protein ParE